MEKKVENDTETVDLGFHKLGVPSGGPDDEDYRTRKVYNYWGPPISGNCYLEVCSL